MSNKRRVFGRRGQILREKPSKISPELEEYLLRLAAEVYICEDGVALAKEHLERKVLPLAMMATYSTVETLSKAFKPVPERMIDYLEKAIELMNSVEDDAFLCDKCCEPGNQNGHAIPGKITVHVHKSR